MKTTFFALLAYIVTAGASRVATDDDYQDERLLNDNERLLRKLIEDDYDDDSLPNPTYNGNKSKHTNLRKTIFYFPPPKEDPIDNICDDGCFCDSNDLTMAVNVHLDDPDQGRELWGPIRDSCTSRVTDMSDLFRNRPDFNEDITAWDVSNVVDFSFMFKGAYSFKQDIGSWNRNSAQDMSFMFKYAHSFDQDISAWGVSKATTMLPTCFEHTPTMPTH